MSDFEKDINKRLKELLDMEDLDEANVTANMDGGEGPVKTPNAFSKSGEEDENDNAEVFDYKKVEENKSTYAKMMSQLHLQEASYNAYKKDDSMSNKKKVNQAISEINRKLFEVEKIMRQNVRLKTEVGVDNGQYWKGTKKKLGKISERILKIAHQFRNLSA
jgi:hypothetical protein